MAHSLLGTAPRDLRDITAQEAAIVLSRFTADDAFSIGIAIRKRLRDVSEKPAVVNISLASGSLLFHATSRPGIFPDNDLWIARKRKTVLRWGTSSWYMHNKMQGDEEAFAKKYMLADAAGEYAIHGGGVPVKVAGVEGVVGVIVVSGLAQPEDHQIVVDSLLDFIKETTPV